MVVLLPVERLDLARGKGQVCARDGQHLVLDPPTGQRLQGRHLPGGDHHMQLGRRVIHQPLHQPADLGHIVHQVVIVQHQDRFAIQLQCQRVEQGRERLGRDPPARLLQGPHRRLAPVGVPGLEGAHQVGQEQQRVAVGVGDRVPGELGLRAAQRGQRRALAIAGAGLHDGQRIVEGLRQAPFQARAAQDAPALPRWDQLAPDHQVCERHGPWIIAQNREGGNRRQMSVGRRQTEDDRQTTNDDGRRTNEGGQITCHFDRREKSPVYSTRAGWPGYYEPSHPLNGCYRQANT